MQCETMIMMNLEIGLCATNLLEVVRRTKECVCSVCEERKQLSRSD